MIASPIKSHLLNTIFFTLPAELIKPWLTRTIQQKTMKNIHKNNVFNSETKKMTDSSTHILTNSLTCSNLRM